MDLNPKTEFKNGEKKLIKSIKLKTVKKNSVKLKKLKGQNPHLHSESVLTPIRARE